MALAQRVARAAALARLSAFAWDGSLSGVREDLERITVERSGTARSEAGEQADAALARWFDSDQSFAELLRDGLGGVLTGFRDRVVAIAHEVTQTVLGSDVAMATATRAARDELDAAGLDLVSVARATLATLQPAVAPGDAPRLDVPVAVVQMKKTFWDRILLRSHASVRRRVLGPDNAPDKPIPRRVKQKRLGATRVVLGEVLRARFARFAAEVVKETVSDTFAAASAAVVGDIRREVEARRGENGSALERSEEKLQALARACADLDALARAVDASADGVAHLAERYGDTSPTVLLEPAEAPVVPLHPES